ncbi:MAG: S49 family peptidase, partial [Spirochaetales bacterium]|nr:S49 family peptidase [Spirochaetales bacterium]
MKKFIIPVLLIIIIEGAFSQEEINPLPVYYTYSELLLAPPGQMDIGLYGFINPAVLAHVNGFDAFVVLSGEDPSFLPVTQWGLFGVLPGIGLGTINTLVTDDIWLTNSRVSIGFGTNALSAGLGYEWSTLDGESLDDAALLTYGILSRPSPYVSFGISGNVNLSWDEYEVAVELGLRPLGNDILTLFSDYAFTTCQEWDDILDGEMSVGLTARLPFLAGLYATGRYFPLSSHFSAGLKFSTGPMAATYQAHFDKDINFTHYSSGLRSGQSEPTLFEEILKDNFYLVLELSGYIDYQVRSLFFKPHTLLEILGTIQSAKTNPIIKGIVINTSGMYADREKLWEIREALKDFKSAGKKVVVYLEGANIDYYSFASIADKILCDPLSMISLDGYMMGMSYYKGLLEKAGIGFEELRILKYKSYYESFSRDSMSEAEREQSLEYINDLYEITKKEVCESRNISDSDYEKFVNEISLFSAREALDRKLIDGITRFKDIQEEVNGLEGREMYLIGPGSLPERNRPYSNEWGAKKRIAVVYALGICDLDSGMSTRQLADDIERASSDSSIKAVVIRVDSPGGSALAGDFMA